MGMLVFLSLSLITWNYMMREELTSLPFSHALHSGICYSTSIFMGS